MWLKYDNAPIFLGEQADRDQPSRLSEYQKPCGFWITDDSEDCWRSWCVGNRFGLESLTHKHQVALDESRILILRSPYELDAFTEQYKVFHWWGPEGEPRKYRDLCIDWQRVAQEHDGLIITPYQWQRRLGHYYSWYYGWDCASGCIWKASTIRDIRLIEIDPDIAKRQEAA